MRKAFLDLLIELNDEGGQLTDKDFRDEVNTMIFAVRISYCLESIKNIDKMHKQLLHFLGQWRIGNYSHIFASDNGKLSWNSSKNTYNIDLYFYRYISLI